MKKLLMFIEKTYSGKTKKFYVLSNHSNEMLGEIHWRTGWRCYVMSYRNDIDMSMGCNDELNDFMKKIESERKSLFNTGRGK